MKTTLETNGNHREDERKIEIERQHQKIKNRMKVKNMTTNKRTPKRMEIITEKRQEI